MPICMVSIRAFHEGRGRSRHSRLSARDIGSQPERRQQISRAALSRIEHDGADIRDIVPAEQIGSTLTPIAYDG
jgi:hypothetical protein